MSRQSSTHSTCQSIQQDLLSLIQLNKSYSNFHKTIITALQKSEILNPNMQNPESAKIVLNANTLNLIVESSKSLLENDLLNTKTLKSLNISVSCLSKSLQLPLFLKQNLRFIESSLKSFTSFFYESCEKIVKCVQIFSLNLYETHKKRVEKIKNDVEKCLLGVLPKSLLDLKPLNFDEVLSNLFHPVLPEPLPQIPHLKKLKDYSKTTQDQLISLTKKLAEVYWDLLLNSKQIKKETLKQNLEKETKPNAKNSEKKTDKSLSKQESASKKAIKAVRPLELKQIVMTKEDALSDGPVTETRIKPGANKSYFGGFDNLLEKKNVNKSYSNLKKRKSSTKALPRNSSNSYLRSNRSSSKKSKFE